LRGSIRRNLEQVRFFGPGVLLRHVRSKNSVYQGQMKGVGTVAIRIDGSDLSTFKQVFQDLEYDLAKLGRAADRVRARYDSILAAGQTPVIIDAGANVGAASRWFAKKFPRAAIVAIEPEPGNAAILRQNVASHSNIAVIEAAIASQPGMIAIAASSTGWDVQTERSESGGIRAVTIPETLAQVPGGIPFIAKIDIEGFESDLFAENLDWIDAMAMLVIEPHDWMLPGRFSSAAFQKAMGERRFELFINGENLIYVAP
jgi:FkbM family methyltransferase